MEQERRKNLIWKVSYLIVLIIIVLLLFKVRSDIKEHYEAFDKNPLLFGAKKYGIVLGEGRTEKGFTIYFDQEKIWQEQRTGSEINISRDLDLFKDNLNDLDDLNNLS